MSTVNDSDVSSSLQSPGSNGEAELQVQDPPNNKRRRLTDDAEAAPGSSSVDKSIKSQNASPVKEETSSEGENDPPQQHPDARMQIDEDVDVESDPDVAEEGEVRENGSLKEKAKLAEGFWMNYIRDNNTVIASSYQGMHKSTITCSVCEHVSCTYEPFMYLALPIPRTTEREFGKEKFIK